MKTYKPHVSSFGDASANLVAALNYVCVMMFWVIGIVPVLILFFMEKKSGLVRFHAIQAILLWLARTLLGGGLTFESVASIITGNLEYMQNPMGWGGSMNIILLRIGIDAVVLLFGCLAVVYAYNWKDWKIPVVGFLAVLICRGCNPAIYNGELEVPYECQIGVDGDKIDRIKMQYTKALVLHEAPQEIVKVQKSNKKDEWQVEPGGWEEEPVGWKENEEADDSWEEDDANARKVEAVEDREAETAVEAGTRRRQKKTNSREIVNQELVEALRQEETAKAMAAAAAEQERGRKALQEAAQALEKERKAVKEAALALALERKALQAKGERTPWSEQPEEAEAPARAVVQFVPETERALKQEPVRLEEAEPAATVQEKKARPFILLEKKKPVDAQLPPDMRDPPPPLYMYNSGPTEAEREGYGTAPVDIEFRREEKMTHAALMLKDTSIDLRSQGDPDEIFDRMMTQNQHMTVIDRAVDWFGKRNRPIVFSLPKKDPNSHLPPDMRDPPPPEMLHG